MTDTESFLGILKERLGEKKLRHSISVMETAERLAEFYGGDREKARIAGLLHDITKQESRETQLQLCAEFGIILDNIEAREEKLLHAITGEAYLRRRLGVEDREILDAVRYHTTGRAAMTLLDKIIYLADYIEPLRNFPGVENVRCLAYVDINGALLIALSQTISEILGRGGTIHPDTVNARNWLITGLV